MSCHSLWVPGVLLLALISWDFSSWTACRLVLLGVSSSSLNVKQSCPRSEYITFTFIAVPYGKVVLITIKTEISMALGTTQFAFALLLPQYHATVDTSLSGGKFQPMIGPTGRSPGIKRSGYNTCIHKSPAIHPSPSPKVIQKRWPPSTSHAP